jgi:hypothetical protein
VNTFKIQFTSTIKSIAIALTALAVHVAAQGQDFDAAKRCIGALNSFTKSIENLESPLRSTDWLKAQRGSIFMSMENNGTSSQAIAKTYEGKKEDITYCSAVKVPVEDISLFLNAYHGYVSSTEPYKGLEQCMAAFIATAPQMDKLMGLQRSQKLGNLLGSYFGKASSRVRWIFGVKQASYEDLLGKANNWFIRIPKDNQQQRTAILNEYAQQCTWYHVPLTSISESARLLKD